MANQHNKELDQQIDAAQVAMYKEAEHADFLRATVRSILRGSPNFAVAGNSVYQLQGAETLYDFAEVLWQEDQKRNKRLTELTAELNRLSAVRGRI